MNRMSSILYHKESRSVEASIHSPVARKFMEEQRCTTTGGYKPQKGSNLAFEHVAPHVGYQ